MHRLYSFKTFKWSLLLNLRLNKEFPLFLVLFVKLMEPDKARMIDISVLFHINLLYFLCISLER